MKKLRTTITATLVALALAALSAAGAAASPLLSGYGGPGQGNQAILGSALLNTPRGGSGGGSAGGSPGGGSIAAEPAAQAAAPSSHAAGGSVTTGTKRRRERTAGTGNASASPARAYRSSTGVTRALVRDASDPLGLSGTDLLFVLLASAALILTGLATRRLAGGSPGPRRG